MTTLKRLCVYCGSSPGRLKAYTDHARKLADALVERDIALVYGGAGVGIMGVIADRVMERGGEAIGVIPEALVEKEVAHFNLSELHVTASMHERKTLMAELADGFIAFPGGLGTLEELFEILTWAQLGFHHKPCGLLNVEGYFDALTQFLEHAVAEQFVKAAHHDMLIVDSDPAVMLDRFASYRPPALERWVDASQT